MKKLIVISFQVVVILLLSVSVLGSEMGEVTPTNCLQGTGTTCVGPTETITGMVVSAGMGSGLVLNTGTTEEVVYGLGPQGYWVANDVDRPDVGEIVTVLVSHIRCTDKRVILEITVGDIILELRDPLTCFPLWR
ncbi:MAG: hypothetical protein AMK71_10110 [Nitrospira bacterium SG8_35_4]|nr:MAG: hypothetical protein AMK71_10110 [Nitrospira bacterium SG8_35_4]